MAGAPIEITMSLNSVVGPEVCDDLALQLGGNVGCQGMGGAYTAGLGENFLPQNTAPQDIQAAVDVFNECNTKCPNANIDAGGYRYVNTDHLR
jgi:cutinase